MNIINCMESGERLNLEKFELDDYTKISDGATLCKSINVMSLKTAIFFSIYLYIILY